MLFTSFWTLFHFDIDVRGSHTRYLSGTFSIHYIPLIKEAQRSEWEDYAYEHRSHIDEAFEDDMKHRSDQDADIGAGINQQRQRRDRDLQGNNNTDNVNITVLDDESGYHMKIWRRGHDEPEGGGIYLPLWQRR